MDAQHITQCFAALLGFAQTEMEHQNSTASSSPHTQSSAHSQDNKSDGNAFFYILIVISFYGVFLCGIMLGYFRSKRREKRRVNIFTRLVHDEERREWGALPKKHSLAFPGAASPLQAVQASLQFCGTHGNHFGHVRYEGALPFPLACALCTEQSSVSSLCSSADTRYAIEEESDSGTAEENRKGGSENSGDDSGWEPTGKLRNLTPAEGKTSPGGKPRRSRRVFMQKRKNLKPQNDFSRRDDVIHAPRGQDIGTYSSLPDCKQLWKKRVGWPQKSFCFSFIVIIII